MSKTEQKIYFAGTIFILILIVCGCTQKPEKFTNSLGIEFALIPSGSFEMGESNTIPDDFIEDTPYLKSGDYDEHPAHTVEISESFYISTQEITIEQFQKFRPSYQGSEKYKPYASGISWYDAVKYCEWLSENENKNYRLPTEAEWEYACRGGTNSLFWSGKFPPDSKKVNAWGLKNMHSGVAEWCSDWHGLYPDAEVEDPIGPRTGLAKIVRGGGLDKQTPFYARSANRASMAPNFPPIPLEDIQAQTLNLSEIKNRKSKSENNPQGFKSRMAYLSFTREVLNNQGNHNIGFRIVQSPMLETEPLQKEEPFVQQGVKQSTKKIAKAGPNHEIPFFRKRYLFPTPPENLVRPFETNDNVDVLIANNVVGLDPGILSHHHSPALTILPNGDVFTIYYTSVSELTPDVAMVAARLRFGAEKWDFPNLIFDFADIDDHAPMLWTEGDTTRFFWGANKHDSGFPFQWTTSTDNGVTWSEVNFPVFETLIGGHSAQPINSAFRDLKGTMYIASDGIGPESVLWKSKNHGKTWIDNGGRSGGRHTSFVLLKNGDILGMGGKSSEIDGYMPKSISSDKGKTWRVEKTPFTPLGSNQRPTAIRLQSGKILFAGDFQRKDGYQPKTVRYKGAYIALSDDEGKTWKVKKLPGVQKHEWEERYRMMKGETLGYSVARQAPNGVIHLITSMNQPSLHFAFNEAWILSDTKLDDESDERLMKSSFIATSDVKQYTENYPEGKIKLKWNAGYAENGQYVLHGPEFWYYPNGNEKYHAEYINGEKVNDETFWDERGDKKWSRHYNNDGIVTWTTYWTNGNKKTESFWKNMHARDKATMWDREGKIIAEIDFENGKPININQSFRIN